MIFQILINLTGALIFLFLFWRRLKEDYSHQIVLDTSFMVIIGIILSQLVSFFFFKHMWFWLSVFAILVTLGVAIYRYKLKMFETIDAGVNGLFPWLILVFLQSSTKDKNIYTLGGFFVILAIYILYHFLNSQYKKYSWYRSGKVGFSGLVVLGVFFFLRLVAGTQNLDMLSFIGKEEVILSGALSFLAFFGVYNLARAI